MADEERYNNRQIERMLDSQSQDLKNHFDESIRPLTEQVTKTNGRVKDLELKNAKQSGYNQGMGVILSVVTVGVMALFGWVLYQVAEEPIYIHQAIQESLSSYSLQAAPNQ